MIDPSLLPHLIGGAFSVALAVWLAWIDIGNVATRIFAALLLVRGAGFFLGAGLHAVDAGSTMQATFWALVPYTHIGLVVLTLAFLAYFPTRRSFFGTTPGAWALILVAAGLAIWYAIDHTVFWTLETVSGSFLPVSFGPLVIITDFRLVTTGIAAAVLAHLYARNPNGSGGFSTFLIAAAFVIGALYNGTVFLVQTIVLAQDYPVRAWTYGDWQAALPIAALPLGILALRSMAIAMRAERDDATLQEARRLLVYVVPIVIVSATFTEWPGVADRWPLVYSFIGGFWLLLTPFLVTYALLRYSLFAIDLRIKAGVRRAIILIMFTTTFFLVTEALETIALGRLDTVAAVLGAVMIGIIARPVQVIAQRAADSFMPDTKPIDEMTIEERKAMYRDQWQMVGEDGVLTSKERAMLDRLAAALGFSEDDAASLERGDVKIEIVHAPATRTEQTALGTVVSSVLVAALFTLIGSVLEALVAVSSFAAGLMAAAAISLLLGPIETLSGKWTARNDKAPVPDEHVRLYEDACKEAIADGKLSRRERIYLHHLAERLGLDNRTRRRRDADILGGRLRAWRRPS